MKSLFTALFHDESGFIVSGELALVSTIGVLGMAAGLAEISGNVDAEMQDVGKAIRSLDQSYSYAIRGQQSSFNDGTSAFTNDLIGR